MARHYGIPYMGSKQKLVDKIVPFILKRHPNTTHFYDLFGGGGSVSLYAVRKYPNLNVHYNELSLAIANLIQHLKDGGNIPFEFISSKDWKAGCVGDDWYAGLLQTCWSFGNGQKSYLYSTEIEPLKKALHDFAITGKGDLQYIEEFADRYNLEQYGKEVHTRIFVNHAIYTTPYQRRIVLQRQIEGHPGVLQHFQYLERLVQISNMPGISDLLITAGKSYDQIQINDNKSVVYCDPPYENTAEYKEGKFDSKKFYDWVMSRPYPVYVSSYKVSDPRFKLVKAVNTRSLLAAAYTDKPTYNYENLYWNGVE